MRNVKYGIELHTALHEAFRRLLALNFLNSMMESSNLLGASTSPCSASCRHDVHKKAYDQLIWHNTTFDAPVMVTKRTKE